jgi:lysophospholipase L1-like esterase
LRKVVLTRLPLNAPGRVNLDENTQRIVFAGDSNTHGNMSFNWTEIVNTNFQKINAGVNADLSFTLLKRLDSIINCKPDYVTILIGTNDVNATMSAKSRKRYLESGKISESDDLSLTSFTKNLTEIVVRLKNESNAKIALISLPPIGEDLNHEVNIKADEYSKSIETIAVAQHISLIDLRKPLKQYIVDHQHVKPPSYESYYSIMIKGVVLRYFLGFSYDKLSQMNQMLLSHDLLHQNSISGNIIAKEVEKWIQKA